MGVSIILPTYNEKENLRILIPKIEGVFKSINHEVLIVDDNSPDGTADYINSLKNKNIRIILRSKKEGIGAALREGYFAAGHNVLLSSDSDLSFEVRDMLRLINKIEEGYDLVIGTRHKKKNYYEVKKLSTAIKYSVSKFGNMIITLITGVDITDFSANFRAIRKDVFDKLILEEKTNTILLEMILKAKYKGFRVGEIPVVFKERKYGESKLNLFKESPKFLLRLLKFTFLYRTLKWKY